MNATEHQNARAEIVEILNETIAKVELMQQSRRGVIALHNSVVRTSPGLYLRPNVGPHGAGSYGVGSITSGVVMWSPEDARAMAEHCRATGGAGAKDAQAVPYTTALQNEADECRRLLGSLTAAA